MSADLRAKIVAVYRAAARRCSSPLVAFEQAVTVVTDRDPSVSRADARKLTGQILASEEGFDAKLLGLETDAAAPRRRPHPLLSPPR